MRNVLTRSGDMGEIIRIRLLAKFGHRKEREGKSKRAKGLVTNIERLRGGKISKNAFSRFPVVCRASGMAEVELR